MASPREHQDAWRAVSLASPGPSAPNCVTWSEDGFLAVATENIVRVLPAGAHLVSCTLHSDAVLSASIDWSSAHGSGKGQWLEDGGLLCPPQLSTQPFVALSWSPLSVGINGCVLCAAVAHVCAVYARPEDPLEMSMQPVAQLSPLVHAALGHSDSPAEAETRDTTVLCSCWSSMVRVGGESGGESGAPVECCFLALAGPAVLAVVTHTPPALDGSGAGRWELGTTLKHRVDTGALACHGGGELCGATAVHFAEPGGGGGAPLHLFSSGADGSIIVWALRPSLSDGGGGGVALACAGTRRVGSSLLSRRVASLSSASIPPDPVTL